MTPNFIFVMVTALTVSVDSFVAGFSLALDRQKSLLLPSTVAIVTYVMCLLACFAGGYLREPLESHGKYVGAGILFALGIGGILKKDDDQTETTSFVRCAAMGFGVGLDGAAAALSLTLQNCGDCVSLPILFASTHFVSVLLGQRLAVTAKPKHSKAISAVMFFTLGTLKLCGM